MSNQRTNFGDLRGKKIVDIDGLSIGSDRIRFDCLDGSAYEMFHYQDCCENVSVEEIIGDISDLIYSEILLAEESTNDTELEGVSRENAYSDDSHLWTFYRLTTIKGSVVIRWLGESNGYYSESVSFEKVG